MKYGQELITALEKDIEVNRKAISDRMDRIDAGLTDMDDCFISQHLEERSIRTAREKIDLIKSGGCSWFTEYATLDGQLVSARWCDTRYGSSLRAEMPDGSVVWTRALTQKGLAKKGLKMVQCKRPAWFTFSSSSSGLLGAYSGDYVLFPSDTNYATGEPAGDDPIEVRDFEEDC